MHSPGYSRTTLLGALVFVVVGIGLFMFVHGERTPRTAVDKPREVISSVTTQAPTKPQLAKRDPPDTAKQEQNKTDLAPANQPKPEGITSLGKYAEKSRAFQARVQEFRAKHAVYASFLELYEDKVAPLRIDGREARLQYVNGGGDFSEEDYRALELKASKDLQPVFRDVVAEAQDLVLSGAVTLSDDQTERLTVMAQMLDIFGGEGEAPGQDGARSEDPRYRMFLGDGATDVSSFLAGVMAVLPRELAEEQAALRAEYDAIIAHAATVDERLPPKPTDPYMADLESIYESTEAMMAGIDGQTSEDK